jgi:hypothetical protein
MTLEQATRKSTLVYVPGYLFSYEYGEVQDDSLEITKQQHQALVPATGARHPHKRASRHCLPMLHPRFSFKWRHAANERNRSAAVDARYADL